MNSVDDMTQNFHLPLELWGSICQWLWKEDIRSTRLACKYFNEAASPFLLRRVWLSSSSEDQKTLTAISLHRIFSKHIKEIYYDGTVYDPELLNVFNDERRYRKYVRKFLKRRSKTTWPKNAMRYAARQYQARCNEQMELQAYQGEHSTRLSNDPPPNLGSLIQAAKGGCGLTDSLFIDKFDRDLPADLICLLSAVQRMANVRKAGISDRRWSESRDWGHYSYATFCDYNNQPNIIQLGKVRGRLTVRIYPQYWPHTARRHAARGEDSKIWYRGFHVLTQAASMLDLKQLQSFTFDGGHEGISYTVLEMTSTELIHVCNAFRHLTTIDMQIDTQNGNPEWDWTKILSSGNVALVLSSAKDLKNLDLGFNVSHTEIPALTKLLGQQTWPRLRYLGLLNMVLEEDELMVFLTKHIRTIESIRFHNIILFDNHLQDPNSTGWTPKSWKGAFRSMSVLALTDLCICIRLRDGGPDYGHWISDDPVIPAEINDFLTSGGVAV